MKKEQDHCTDSVDTPFKVGDRVSHNDGMLGVVAIVDTDLGVIVVEYDNEEGFDDFYLDGTSDSKSYFVKKTKKQHKRRRSWVATKIKKIKASKL